MDIYNATVETQLVTIIFDQIIWKLHVSPLDLNNVPVGQISGKIDNELKWITSENFDRYLYELSDGFVWSLEEQESDIDPKVDEELKKMEIESIPKFTMDQMKRTSNRFINFLKAKSCRFNWK